MSFTSFQIAPSNCLNCGKQMDGCTNGETDDLPNDGDVTVCIYCGHIMAFDAERKLRALTDQEMRDVAGNPLIVEINRVRGEFFKEKKP